MWSTSNKLVIKFKNNRRSPDRKYDFVDDKMKYQINSQWQIINKAILIQAKTKNAIELCTLQIIWVTFMVHISYPITYYISVCQANTQFPLGFNDLDFYM